MTMAISAPIKPTAPTLGLCSQRSTQRLNQIEKIRANGIGDLVDLPQLVVCGDQSAGKSSVLEGITGIPFPRQEGLCTRFPTEIILRHSNEPLKTKASIRPHSGRSAEVARALRSYEREMTEDLSDLPVAIEQVSKLMGIRGFTDSQADAAFASDALRIEVTGPTGLQLSIVDLPGLISVANEEQSEADVEAVHAMVRSYLSSSRTIILAVVQASNDIANQGIIKIAREYDPDGQRTVGIITKPDLINAGTEARLASIAKNRDSIKLKLGFFLLKNPSPAEMKASSTKLSRPEREMNFFSSAVWKAQDLDMDRVGIENLKVFLQELLDEHLEREMPKLKVEIRRVLEAKEKELEAMGPERRSLGDIRTFMTNLSMRYYTLAQAALEGNYHSSDAQFFDKTSGTRLRSLVHRKNGEFAALIRTRGHRREMLCADKSPKTAMSSDVSSQLVVTRDEMILWIQEVGRVAYPQAGVQRTYEMQTYLQTRGRELPGNYNHVLLAELFHEQSSPWRKIAENHVSEVVDGVCKWINQAVFRLFPEDRLRRDLEMICQERLEGCRADAFEELRKILLDEERHPVTYNHYYTDNIQKARCESQKEALQGVINGLKLTYDMEDSGDRERLIKILQPKICVNMNQQACEEALTGLNAYYKVAMKTFVDNVCRQVIERHILVPLPEIFYPNTVSQFTDEELLRIGSESERETSRRQKLGEAAEGLRNSLLELHGFSG
ncbi:Interferon-induced GTP-binding protein Mx2 [Colletotrichum tanaceti]|uniref:Interferon-induced GTP-binding protein Mx2 n=1 Tax=Colletotrichum tanaceti TaxID=1306861 RepID=A0A4U6XS14_9PEZI|nr:Interferon-induced GTP-binding protein Mx2 [Colletotrichum tanaceti]TKW58632.1 Interferon-induced GTP-binding protein Mx2 [Colletotrichum tanaceti]